MLEEKHYHPSKDSSASLLDYGSEQILWGWGGLARAGAQESGSTHWKVEVLGTNAGEDVCVLG